MNNRNLLLFACLGAAASVVQAEPETNPAQAALGPKPLTPATVTWGGFNGNDQLVDSADKWPFVQKNMDGFLMHGAYWLNIGKGDQYERNLKALGEILKKNGKTADVESGFGEYPTYVPNDPQKRDSTKRAQNDIARFQTFENNGITINKVRVDWFPTWAMAAYAAKWGISDMPTLMQMVTGAEEFGGKIPAEFDMKTANWVDYGKAITKANPNAKVVFDQALCNHRPVNDPEMRKLVPWPAFGYGYERALATHAGVPVLVNGKPVVCKFDFADLLNGVMLASKKYGINFYGFEGDTPYNYISDNLDAFSKEKLTAYLLEVERFLHSNGLHDARIINDAGSARYGDSSSWVKIDLGMPIDIDHVRVVWGQDFSTETNLSTSLDDKSWQDAPNLLSDKGAPAEIRFPTRQARYVKIKPRKHGTPRGFQIAEIEVFGPAAPMANLAMGKRANASGSSKNHPSTGLKANKGLTEILDGNQKTYWESDYVTNDSWDKTYHDRTLEYLEYYQAAGGRPDEFVAASWYDGPFTYFPETKDGTFSNLARDIIRRIKGLNDDSSPMKATLSARAKGPTAFASCDKPVDCALKPGETREFEIQVRNDSQEINKGDARCTPLLRIDEKIPEGFKVSLSAADGKNITEEVLAHGNFDGHFIGGLEPGETKIVTVIIKGPSAPDPGKVGAVTRYWNQLKDKLIPPPPRKRESLTFKLYWNPQDPKSVVRDKARFVL